MAAGNAQARIPTLSEADPPQPSLPHPQPLVAIRKSNGAEKMIEVQMEQDWQGGRQG